LAKQSELSNYEETTNLESNSELSLSKKPFIEPELSAAVDVLEATAFFQTATSGVTN
jgi:hypothetical protein